jgi:hypothetical protein
LEQRQLPGRQEQVHVVGHQDVYVKRAFVLGQGCFQPMQIAEVIFFAKEARLAIVAALHDVQGYSIQMDTGRRGMALHKVFNASLVPLIRSMASHRIEHHERPS